MSSPVCVGDQGVEGDCIHCHPVTENIASNQEIFNSSFWTSYLHVCIQTIILHHLDLH